jgi:hypothetical protein
MREFFTAFFMVCIVSTTALNLAFTFMPGQMTSLVKDIATAPSN